MIITYLRSSSYGTHSFCPMQYFIEYNLGYKSPSNKKADKGTICHKVLEILAYIKLTQQQGSKIFNDDIAGEINIQKYSIEKIYNIVYQYYIERFHHHEWTKTDHKDCYNWINKALDHNDGMFDPRNREIIQPEQHFDIIIDKPWASYKYNTEEGLLQGQLGIKGTIDLITKVNDNTFEIIDWKTGRRLDWATGEEKSLAKLHKDAQLMIYFYAVQKLYPEIDHFIVSINFINDGGPFSVCFDKSNLYDVEIMLKNKFEIIKNTKRPSQYKSWKCSKLCHFGKSTFDDSPHLPIIEYRDEQTTPFGQTMTKCEQIHHDIALKGMDAVIKEYKVPGYSVGQYKAPGSAE
jgi:CRISPR/Cas system-associated exonuclease Cas4 (RecB family)